MTRATITTTIADNIDYVRLKPRIVARQVISIIPARATLLARCGPTARHAADSLGRQESNELYITRAVMVPAASLNAPKAASSNS